MQSGTVLTAGTSGHELLHCCHRACLLLSLGWLHGAGQMGSVTNAIMAEDLHVQQKTENYLSDCVTSEGLSVPELQP